MKPQTRNIPADTVRPSPRDDARAWSPPSGGGRIRRWPVDPYLRCWCWTLVQMCCRQYCFLAAAEVEAEKVRPMCWYPGRFRRLVWTTNKECRPLPRRRSRLRRDGSGYCPMSNSSFRVRRFLNTMFDCVKSIPQPFFLLNSLIPNLV